MVLTVDWRVVFVAVLTYKKLLVKGEVQVVLRLAKKFLTLNITTSRSISKDKKLLNCLVPVKRFCLGARVDF